MRLALLRERLTPQRVCKDPGFQAGVAANLTCDELQAKASLNNARYTIKVGNECFHTRADGNKRIDLQQHPLMLNVARANGNRAARPGMSDEHGRRPRA